MVAIAILAGFKWAIPQMVLPNLWPLGFALPGILLMVTAQFAILTLFPPTVTIRADQILIQHGESVTIIDPKTVTATYLTFHPDEKVRLRICCNKNLTAKSRVIGVPPTVGFNRLSELLPISQVARDARSRRFEQPKPQDNATHVEQTITRF